MKKKLVGVESLDDYICQSSKKIYADGTIILTPGAKDALSKRGISIVYGPRPEACEEPAAQGACPPGCTCPACTAKAAEAETERLVLAVAAMLKTEYGITDLAELKKLSCQVVKAIKDNI